MHRHDLEETTSIANSGYKCPWAVWPLGEIVAKDSYIGHPLSLLWQDGCPRVTGYFSQYTNHSWIPIQEKKCSRQRNGDQAQPNGNRGEAENTDQDAAARDVE